MFDTVHRFAADRYALAQLCDALLPASALVGLVRQLRSLTELLTQLPLGEGETELTLAGGQVFIGQRQTLVSPARGNEWSSSHFNRTVFVNNPNFSAAMCEEVVWWSDENTPDAPEVLYQADVLVYGLLSELTGCSVATMARAFALEQGVSVNLELPEPDFPEMFWTLAFEAKEFREKELCDEARSARMQGATRG